MELLMSMSKENAKKLTDLGLKVRLASVRTEFYSDCRFHQDVVYALDLNSVEEAFRGLSTYRTLNGFLTKVYGEDGWYCIPLNYGRTGGFTHTGYLEG